jgi:Winged helix DNA-binding domain
MPRAGGSADDRIRRLRVGAQLLDRPRRRAPGELVRHLTGVQAQVAAAAGLALRARSPGLTAEVVERALERDRSIVLTWAMRGTLHLIAAEDHGWLVPLVVEPKIANAHRRLAQEGVRPEQTRQAMDLIERALGSDGPLTRVEIAERLRRRGVPTEGQAIAHLVWLAGASGKVCYGPDRDGTRTFVLVRDWLAVQASMVRDPAPTELAIRYLAAHGPAGPEDLAAWSGIRMRDARAAWRSVEDRLVEVPTPRGTRWMLRSRRGRAPTGVVRLLPAFDEFLLGWKDRSFAVAPGNRRAVNRGGGWVYPVVIADGRVVATWRAEQMEGSLRVVVRPLADLSPEVRRSVVREARDVGTFQARATECVFDR